MRHHKRKIAWSAPIIFLVLINTSDALGAGNIFLFESASNIFLTKGEVAEVTLSVRTKSPINAVGGTVAFTPSIVRMSGLSRITSVIDLWTEEPLYAERENMLHFSGGMFGAKTESPTNGTVFVMTVTGESAGVATITMTEGQLLAANGEGTNLISGSNMLTLYVREQGAPSPDINGDGELSVADANALYLKTFRAYDVRYDMNADKKLSWADVRFLLRLF